MPATIEVIGDSIIDTETAQLAIALRDAGMSEREAVKEAQRVRDAYAYAYTHPVVARYTDGGEWIEIREGTPEV